MEVNLSTEKQGFIRFDKIDKSYDGEVLVVKNLNLNIAKGEFEYSKMNLNTTKVILNQQKVILIWSSKK